MRRTGAVKSRCPKFSLGQTNEAPALASWPTSLGSTARRSLGEARCVVSSRPMLAHFGSKWPLQFRKMHCALFQTNLPSLHWSVSSGLINLLVVRLAISLQPGFPTLSKQGPRGLARGPWTKLFPIPSSGLPLHVAARIRRIHAQRFDCQKCLIFQYLARLGFAAFLRQHLSAPCTCPTRRDSAIQRPNVSCSRTPRYSHPIGLRHPARHSMREFHPASALNRSTTVEFFTIFRAQHAPAPTAWTES
jgi:hypothetical protein